MDYCLANYVVAIIVALTLGEVGTSTTDMPNFTAQTSQVWSRGDMMFWVLWSTPVKEVPEHMMMAAGQWSIGGICSGRGDLFVPGQPGNAIRFGLHKPVPDRGGQQQPDSRGWHCAELLP